MTMVALAQPHQRQQFRPSRERRPEHEHLIPRNHQGTPCSFHLHFLHPVKIEEHLRHYAFEVTTRHRHYLEPHNYAVRPAQFPAAPFSKALDQVIGHSIARPSCRHTEHLHMQRRETFQEHTALFLKQDEQFLKQTSTKVVADHATPFSAPAVPKTS